MPQLIDVMASDDTVLGCAAAFDIGTIIIGSPALVPALVESVDIPRAVWELHRRITVPGQPASWWKERAEVLNLDTFYLAVGLRMWDGHGETLAK